MALANDIGRFFVRKIERIRCDIDAVDVDHTARDALLDDLMLVNSTQLFSDFQPLKEEDVHPDSFRNQTRSLARLTRCRHPLVVKCLDVLLPVITRIIAYHQPVSCIWSVLGRMEGSTSQSFAKERWFEC